MPLTPAERELFQQLRRAYKAMYLAIDRYFVAEAKAGQREAEPDQRRFGGE